MAPQPLLADRFWFGGLVFVLFGRCLTAPKRRKQAVQTGLKAFLQMKGLPKPEHESSFCDVQALNQKLCAAHANSNWLLREC